jgi:hypothetical protein
MRDLVESAWGAVPMLPSVRFPRPLAEPAVRISTQRALHGVCRQAWLARFQGVGIVLPRYRYLVIGTLARLNSSIPSAEGRAH